MALLDDPCNCQAFQFNDSISAFCIGEESQPSLHHPPVSVAVGWLLEKEEAQTEGASICVKAGLLGGVKVVAGRLCRGLVSRGNHCVCSEATVVVLGLV